MRDLNAFGATLPQIYVQRLLLNAANGVPQLDVNSRMQNAYLPTDISRTNLTASGKVKSATLEVTAGSTLAGVSTSGNVAVGGTLSAVGAITGPSIDVGTGLVKGATGDIPEITSDTFKAKATTLSSLTVPGVTSLAALNLSGDLTAQAVSATALSSSGGITATGEVSAATIRSTTGSLIAEGPTSLQAVTVAGVLNTQAITAAQQIRANGGLRLGVGVTLSQVDTNNNNVPIKVAGGIDVNGALTNVTSLQTTAALTIGGAINATGKGTFASLESQGNLVVAGALTGITDLSISGNLSVVSTGKQISATAISTGSLNASGQSTLAGVTATALTVNGAITATGVVSAAAATADTHLLRRREGMPMVHTRYPSAQPSIPTNSNTPIIMDTWQRNDGLVTVSGSTMTINRSGIWLITMTGKFVARSDAGTKAISIQADGARITGANTATWEGGVSCAWQGLLNTGTDVVAYAFHTTTRKGSETTDNLRLESGYGCLITLTWLKD